jgi:hypothetical protein
MRLIFRLVLAAGVAAGCFLVITDPFEASIAVSAQGQHVIAGGIATPVSQYFTPGRRN